MGLSEFLKLAKNPGPMPAPQDGYVFLAYDDLAKGLIAKDKNADLTQVQAPTFAFQQTTPSDEWIINHNLGFKPSVVVLDQSGEVIMPSVTHVNLNQLIVSFTTPMAGSVRLV